MTAYAQSFRQPAGGKLRLRVAGIAVLVAIALAVYALKFQTKPYLTSAPAGRHSTQQYSRMSFDVADDLVGAFWQDDHLTIDRWAGANPPATWHFHIAPSDLWTIAADTSRVAWISGPTLHWQATAPGARASAVPLPHQEPMALSLLSNGSVAVVFATGVRRWDSSTGRDLGEWQTGLSPADRAAAEGDYIAFSSYKDGELRVFSFQDQQWTQAQQALSPEIPERVVLPAPSVAGTVVDGRLRIAGITRSSPGAIRSVGAHLYDALVAGDFDGIYVLPPDGEYYRLADAPRGSLVAGGETQMAVSGSGGTTLFNLGSEMRLTTVGRRASLAAVVIVLLASILAAGPLLLQAIAVLFSLLLAKGKQQAARVPGSLAQPPADLIAACAGGQTVLWAGAGLSAQSGFPTRAGFILTVLETAMLEYAGAPLIRKLKALAAAGKGENALNQLIAAMKAHRGAILAHFSAIFGRFSSPSRSHELLARLNFPSAITTNYDVLLEQTCREWARNVVTPGDPGLNGRFLLKLYGSLSVPLSVLLCRGELEAAIERPTFVALRQIFSAVPMLFIGCSLDGLLADLKLLRMPEDSTQIRYAVAGVSGTWEKTAAELSRRYGIQVLPCSENGIGEALPAFLDSLLRSVDKSRQPENPPAFAKTNLA